MTEQEIASIQNAIKTTGLNFVKFPKKIEIRFPKAKYPGIYLLIPTDLKSFKLQVYCHQTSVGFLDKLNLRGYEIGGGDLHKTFPLKDVKGIPSEEEVIGYLDEALEKAALIGIVRVEQAAS